MLLIKSVEAKLIFSLVLISAFTLLIILLVLKAPATFASLGTPLNAPLSASLFNNSLSGKPQLSQSTKLTRNITLAPFQLLNHKQEIFTEKSLLGQWHLISYGYTSCPDVCPTTLLLLSQLENNLKADNKNLAVNVLFYTVDPKRDTPEKLALYLSYFSHDFTGIRASDKKQALAFEHDLGIKALVDEGGDNGRYQVSHGINMFLINPNGQLQAIFQPRLDPFGNSEFDLASIYLDYLVIRQNWMF